MNVADLTPIFSKISRFSPPTSYGTVASCRIASRSSAHRGSRLARKAELGAPAAPLREVAFVLARSLNILVVDILELRLRDSDGVRHDRPGRVGRPAASRPRNSERGVLRRRVKSRIRNGRGAKLLWWLLLLL